MRQRFVQHPVSGELVPAEQYAPEPRALHHVMPDIKEYRSMIDGSVVSSRSRHREHLISHGCIEVGNETKYLAPRPKQLPPGLKQTIIEVTNAKLRRK